MGEIGANLLLTSLAQGLLLGIVALGVVIAFRFVDFPDLTVDGSFVLGAAIAAKLIFSGVNPFLATLLAVPCGGLAGLATGLLHTKLGVSKLLAGILMMTMLYSVNLRVMGRSNIPLIDRLTVFDFAAGSRWLIAAELGGVTAIIVAVMVWFLRTELGTSIRAVGQSERMLAGLGIPVDYLKVTGLAITNMLAALGGAFYAQHQGYCDVSMGIGTILIALAAIVLGEAFVQPTSSLRVLLAALIGACLYRLVVTLAIFLGLPPTDVKLVTGLLVVGVLLLRRQGKDASRDAIARNY